MLMRKFMILVMSVIFVLFASETNEANASVDQVSVTTHRSGNSVTAYVKNNDNKNSQSVYLQLMKNGSTISSKSVKVNKNQQVKVVFSLSSKGAYVIKYTVNNKSDFTAKFGR
jgi:hypothetical protein